MLEINPWLSLQVYFTYKCFLPGYGAYSISNICRSEYFANSLFPYTIKEWNKLSLEIFNSESYDCRHLWDKATHA